MHPEKQEMLDRKHGTVEEGTVTEASAHDDYFSVGYRTDSAGTMGFTLASEYGFTPKVGDRITVYSHRGMMIRGVDLNGEEVFFKSSVDLEVEHEEQQAEHRRKHLEAFDRDREKLDAQYDALPKSFQARIDIFRETNKDFRWDFESYESFSCTEAMKIFEYITSEFELGWPEKEEDITRHVAEFHELKYEDQIKRTGMSDDHSGNTFGTALLLARAHLMDVHVSDERDPRKTWVYLHHGALTPLVGCKDYGCPHPR